MCVGALIICGCGKVYFLKEDLFGKKIGNEHRVCVSPSVCLCCLIGGADALETDCYK